MAPTVRVLIADDNPTDAELEVQELKRSGMRVAHKVVDRSDDFRKAISAFGPDVILSDFSMPDFDGMEALRIAKEEAPEIPFIFVSGTLGEEYAIRALKSGAVDYVVKGNLKRLPSAVERAVADAQAARERRRMETELDIARERVRLSEAALRRAQSMAKLAHLVTGAEGSFESWSETLPEIIGEDPARTGRTVRSWLERMHPADRDAARQRIIEAEKTGERTQIELRIERAGEWVHLRLAVEPLEAADGPRTQRWFSTVQDVTEEKQAERTLARLNRVYAVLSGINGLIVRVSSREELFKEACRIAVEAGGLRMAWLGLYDAERQRVDPVACHGHEQGFLRLMSLSLADTVPEGRGLVRRTVREKRPVAVNDIEHDAKVRLRAEALKCGFLSGAVLPLLIGGELIGVFGLFAGERNFFDEAEMRLLMELAGDIAFGLDHIEKSERLDYLAYFDGLTGLANRALFLQRLEQALLARPADRQLAVMVMDVDRFKSINDALGRQKGDELLELLAARLLRQDPEGTRFGRVGADDFAVFTPAENEDDIARQVQARLEHDFGAPFRLGDSELLTSAKVGIAVSPGDGAHAEALVQKAEAALKRAKTTGDKYLFHTPGMTERIAENLALENKLRRALEKDEFVLHYQPKAQLATRRIVGLEALIRWQSPELGLVPPMQFIPLLEETGLILEVGAWALRRAAADHRRWVEDGLTPPRVAVNVSAIQLRQRDFVATVQRAIAAGATPVGIDLEITESLVMQDIQAHTAKLSSVRALGLEIAIDDFGTGYSSLAYLAKLPAQLLKIDRSFIHGMLKDPHATTLVKSIIGLAHSLGLRVVAEGVESEEQASLLAELGCDQMQGYVFSKPIGAEEMRALLEKAQTTPRLAKSRASRTR